MCRINMVYNWFKENGRGMVQLCGCINRRPGHMKDSDLEKHIQHYNNRESAIRDGWKYNRNNEWVCPDCAKQAEEE